MAKKKKSKSSETSDDSAVDAEIVSSNLPAPVLSEGLAKSDPLAAYLQEIRRYPLMSPEEEQKVARHYYETKDPKAAEKLVTSNLRFVVKVASDYAKFGARMIDLVQEGNVGLMQAVKEFNPYKGVRLITYAVWWIRGYIQEYLMRQYSLVRIGTTHTQRKLFYQLRQERQKLEAQGQKMGIQTLSERLGVSEEDIANMEQRLSGRDVSLDAPLDDESGTSLMSFQTDNQSVGVDDRIGRQEEMALLQDSIDDIKSGLNEKERLILEKRLLADEPMTLQEIGDVYGMTRERARQLEARIIEKLKKAYHTEAEPKEKMAKAVKEE